MAPSQRWSYLGHAGWLCEVDGLRILFDPLLEPAHHGGVFEVAPRRTVHAEALRPDFLVVSHAHTDHFDLPSLARLARLDADTVLFTADERVARAALRLGFRAAHTAQPLERLELDGPRLLTTRSYVQDVREWGVLVEHQGLTAWNQVDTVHRSPEDVRATLAVAAEGLGLPALSNRVELLLARWQPLCELAPMLAERAAFPFRGYAATLEELAAANPRSLLPASAGGRHAGPFAWLDAFTHPVPTARFLEDARARMPGLTAHAPLPGDRFLLTPEGLTVERGAATELVTLEAQDRPAPPEAWRPVHVPELFDHNPWGYPEARARELTRAWVRGALAEGLARSFPRFAHPGPLRLALELRFAGRTDGYTLEVDARGVLVRESLPERWDALNVLSGSSLCAVLEARACWGDVLLSGSLRAFERAYTVTPEGLTRARLGVTFVYYGLAYEESFERFLEAGLERLGARGA